MTFTEHTWTSTGWPGQPGYMKFRYRGECDDATVNTALANTRTFLQTMRTYLPSSITLTPDVQVKYINEVDGAPTGVLGVSSVPSFVVGLDASKFAGVAGACLVWRTGVPSGRRLLTGRTFWVPMPSGEYGTDGKILPGTITGMTSAFATWISSWGLGVNGHPIVWHRPKPGQSGFVADIKGMTVNPYGAELKSRRS